MNSITQKDIDRFWGKVDKKSSDIFYKGTRCWICPSKQRYASIWFSGVYLKAHRISWIISYGDIPNKINILHHCDNTHCVNPSHLFSGTQLDNVHDMISKGRKWVGSGEKNPNHKITIDKVRELREIHKKHSPFERRGYNVNSLCKKYGISRTQFYSIVNYETWKEVS